MRKTNTKKIHNTALLFILIAPFSVFFYASYVFNPIHMGNIWLYILQLIGDGIAIINLAALWLTILLDIMQPEYFKRNIKYNKEWIISHYVTVDVLIPVTKEPLDIIENTVSHCVNMDYPHKTFILDDGPSEEVKQLACKYAIQYVARPPHIKSYAKSGNINYGLKRCSGEFFAVFDADHAPKKVFLSKLLPYFQNQQVALVQTPQHYINTDNFIARGTAQAQEIFYKYVQPAKNSYNSSFCVGTNMLFRRKAIDQIGGIALVDHSEDIWTTILLHEKGWESVFYNATLADGRAPDNIQSFFRQQSRWARGGFSLFFRHNPLFIKNLTTDQRIQYFFSNVHYFTGFSILIYLILPIIYLLTNMYPMDAIHSSDWPIHYIPYFITFYFLPLFLLGKLHIATISTALASFYPYIKAFISVGLKNKYTWIATEYRRKTMSIIMGEIWPHVFIIVLSLLAIIVGWYNVIDVTTTTIVSFWALVNAYLLYAFIKNGLMYRYI